MITEINDIAVFWERHWNYVLKSNFSVYHMNWYKIWN